MQPLTDVGSPYHHGSLRDALLDASREILGESGARGLSLREAARRAGVSTAAPYRHFKDKEALLIALSEAAFTRLDVALEATAIREAGRPALDRVASLGVTYVGFAAHHPAEFRLMFGELAPAPEQSPSLAKAVAAAAAHLPRAIAQFTAELEPPGPSVEDLTLLAWSVVHGLSTLYLDGHVRQFSTDGAEQIAARVSGILVAALRGRIHGA